MAHSWRLRRVAQIAALLGLLGFIALLLTPRAAVDRTQGAAVDSSARAAAVAPGATSDAVSDRRDSIDHAALASAHEPRAAGQMLRGRVLDGVFRVPLAARVAPASGQAVIARAHDGFFEFDTQSCELSRLTVAAARYRTRELSASEVQLEPLEILLEPALRSAVKVVNEQGAPLPGAIVEWSALDEQAAGARTRDAILSRVVRSGESNSTQTGADGLAHVPAGLNTVASVRATEGGPVTCVRVAPAQTVLVVLPSSLVSVRFVDAGSFAPLSGLEFDLWSPRAIHRLAAPQTSDSDGVIRFPADWRPVVLRLSGAAVWQQTLEPLSPGLARDGFGGDERPMLRIEHASDGEEFTVAVRSAGGRLRLIDAVTRTPIDGLARVELKPRDCLLPEEEMRCVSHSPRAWSGDRDGNLVVRGGELAIPTLGAEAEALPLAQRAERRVAISVEGYRPASVEFTNLPRRHELLEVELTPDLARWVRVVHTDDSPFQESVVLYSRSAKSFLWNSRGASDGRHGPFDWPGGDVFVRIEGDNGPWERKLDASELENNTVAALTVEGGSGSIRLIEIPPGLEGLDLLACGGRAMSRLQHTATALDAGEARFTNLPAGQYLVGPAKWVRSTIAQTVVDDAERLGEDGVGRGRIQVRPGEESIVRWDVRWLAQVPIEGRVRVIGRSTTQPFLVPLYTHHGVGAPGSGTATPKLVLSRRSPRIELDFDGRYRIDAQEPLPSLMAVCLPLDAPWGSVLGFQVVESIRPGDSVDVATADIRLIGDPSKSGALASVRWEVPPSSLRAPVKTFHAARELRWSLGEDLLIEGVPVSVRSLRVHQKGAEPRELALELESGALLELRLE